MRAVLMRVLFLDGTLGQYYGFFDRFCKELLQYIMLRYRSLVWVMVYVYSSYWLSLYRYVFGFGLCLDVR